MLGEDELHGPGSEEAQSQKPAPGGSAIDLATGSAVGEGIATDLAKQEAELKRRLQELPDSSRPRPKTMPAKRYPPLLQDVLVRIPTISSPDAPVSFRYTKEERGIGFQFSWHHVQESEAQFASLEIKPFPAYRSHSRSRLILVEPFVYSPRRDDPALPGIHSAANEFKNSVMDLPPSLQMGLIEELVDLAGSGTVIRATP